MQAHRDKLFFVVTVAVLAILWRLQGTVVSPDGVTFAAWGKAMIDHGYLALISGAVSTAPPVLYSGIISLVALCQALAGESWAHLLVAANILSLGALAVVLSRLVARISFSRLAPLIGFLLFLICYDLLQWARYALSDVTYVLIATSFLALLCYTLTETEDRAVSVTLLVAVTTLATFYRPTGFLLWPCLIASLWMRSRIRQHLPLPRVRTLCAVAITAAVVAIAANAVLMARPQQFGSLGSSNMIQHQVRHYRTGEVVWDRPETWLAPPATVTDYARITLARGCWFWAPWCQSFSLAHKVVNALFFLPCYALALITVCSLITGGGPWSTEQRAALGVLILFIYTTALWHAMVQIDYDWRYRLPALCPLIVLAACGGDLLLRRGRIAEAPSRSEAEPSEGA